jgi:hypothetical protein
MNSSSSLSPNKRRRRGARELLVLACTDVENAWAQYRRRARFAPRGRGYTTYDHVRLHGPLHLAEYEVSLAAYVHAPSTRPFDAWDGNFFRKHSSARTPKRQRPKSRFLGLLNAESSDRRGRSSRRAKKVQRSKSLTPLRSSIKCCVRPGQGRRIAAVSMRAPDLTLSVEPLALRALELEQPLPRFNSRACAAMCRCRHGLVASVRDRIVADRDHATAE